MAGVFDTVNVTLIIAGVLLLIAALVIRDQTQFRISQLRSELMGLRNEEKRLSERRDEIELGKGLRKQPRLIQRSMRKQYLEITIELFDFRHRRVQCFHRSSLRHFRLRHSLQLIGSQHCRDTNLHSTGFDDARATDDSSAKQINIGTDKNI